MTQLATLAMMATSNKRPPAFRSGANSAALGTSTLSGSCNIPAGTRVGDVLIAAVAGGGADTVATPAGWSLQGGAAKSSTGTGTQENGYLFTRVADGTEGASLTVTKTGTASQWRIVITAWGNTAGVDTFASNSVASAGDTSPVAPSITPTVDNSTIVSIIICRQTGAFTPPTHTVTTFSSVTAPSVAFAKTAPVPASASGTQSWTFGLTTKWVTFTLGIKHI